LDFVKILCWTPNFGLSHQVSQLDTAGNKF
jgi:hypothetical protein